MDWKAWFRPPRHLLVLFLGITLISASTLGWLSWRLVLQDRLLSIQRTQEQRENAASQAVAALQKNLSIVEERLAQLSSLSVDQISSEASAYSQHFLPGAALLIFQRNSVEAHPANSIAYYPVDPPADDTAALDAVNETDSAQGDDAKIARLKSLSHRGNPSVQAHALLRLGGHFRRLGRWLEAIATYEELSKLEHVTVFGNPAELAARGALCDVLQAQGDRSRLIEEATAIQADLNSAHWRLSRAVYDTYSIQVRRILGENDSREVLDTVALSEAAQFLSEQWQERKELKPKATFWASGKSILLVSRPQPDRLIAFIAAPRFLTADWMQELERTAESDGARLALADTDGRSVIGQVDPADDHQSIRLSSMTGLPWTLYAAEAGGTGSANSFTVRTQLVVAGVLAIALLVLGGSYLITRAVSRELAVAKLQSDFVSAVSHEFRTPLTAMRQLSELLARGRIPSEEIRQKYYEVLEYETGRLHRLVEGLLNFGRMEAGAMRYQFEAIDGDAFLRSLVEEFKRNVVHHNASIELQTSGHGAQMWADREAIGCVVWNLLDNAVKYSPENPTVSVDLCAESGRIGIRVRDRGVGILPQDQQRVFQKFERGEMTRSLGVQGTGIGLAIARQIVEEHRGEIRVDSQPGVGSTFTVLLPIYQER